MEDDRMSEKFYTEDHEWVSHDNGECTIGISKHAADELGEVVFVDLNDEGSDISVKDEFGSVESVKTVSGLYSPVEGEISSVNQSVVDSPELLSDDPEGAAWLVKIKVSNFDSEDLMTESAYKEYLETL